MTLPERIAQLVAQHGSLRAVARVTEIDVSYLSRLKSGEKVNPEKDKLRRLGLRRVVNYERTKMDHLIDDSDRLKPCPF